jgi:hypothetical protein
MIEPNLIYASNYVYRLVANIWGNIRHGTGDRR